MAKTLRIVKNAGQEGNWSHLLLPNLGEYEISAFYLDIDNGMFQIKEFNGGSREKHVWSDIELLDNSMGAGVVYNPSSIPDLVNWLVVHKYTPYFYLFGSGGSTVIQAGTGISVTGTGTIADPFIITNTGGSGGGGIQTIVAGTGINVDATDPNNPIVSVTGIGYTSWQQMYNADPANTQLTDGVNTFYVDPANAVIFSDIANTLVEPAVGIIDPNTSSRSLFTASMIDDVLLPSMDVSDDAGHYTRAYGDGLIVQNSNGNTVSTRADNITIGRNQQRADANGTPVFSITDGTTTATADDQGLVDISAMVGGGSQDLDQTLTNGNTSAQDIVLTDGSDTLTYKKNGLEMINPTGDFSVFKTSNTIGISSNNNSGNSFSAIASFGTTPLAQYKVHASTASEASISAYEDYSELHIFSPDGNGEAYVKQASNDFRIGTKDEGNVYDLVFPIPNAGANGIASLQSILDGSTEQIAWVSDIPGPITIDSVPTDGSTNAVQSNGVFDALETKQPLDSDLTEIAALTTTSFGRSLLTQADAAATRATIGAGTGNGDALTANPLSQFAATTSLQLKNTISDETGSGALVFAISPTFVMPALGTPASGVLTNATGLPQSGVVNLTTDLAAKAPLASPALTGAPTAPTAAANTNTTQLATTAFIQAALAAKRYATYEFKASAFSPLDNTSYFFANINNLAPEAVTGIRYVKAAVAATNISFSIATNVASALAVGDESATVILKNLTAGTSVTLSTVVKATTIFQAIQGTVAFTVAAGDNLQIEFQAPNYATNPTNVYLYTIINTNN